MMKAKRMVKLLWIREQKVEILATDEVKRKEKKRQIEKKEINPENFVLHFII